MSSQMTVAVELMIDVETGCELCCSIYVLFHFEAVGPGEQYAWKSITCLVDIRYRSFCGCYHCLYVSHLASYLDGADDRYHHALRVGTIAEKELMIVWSRLECSLYKQRPNIGTRYIAHIGYSPKRA